MSTNPSPAKKRRAVILGTGGIARAHAAAIQANSDRLEFAGVADIDPAKAAAFAEEHGAAVACHDPAELLERVRPHLVHVCTPPGAHADLTIAAMRAGADVLCEKPLCASLAELDRIERAQKETGRTYASVFQMRFGASTGRLLDLMRRGLTGKPLVALAQTTWYRPPSYYEVPWRGKWATELGGPTMGHGIHAMDHLLHLLGEWSEVRAMLGRLDRSIEVEDVSMALLRFENGAMASLINSILSPREETRIRIDFQRATAEVVHLYGYKRENWRLDVVDREADAALLEGWEVAAEEDDVSHATQLRVLLDDLEAGRPHITGGPGARGTIELLAALYKSGFTGLPVRRGSIVPGDPFYAQMHGGCVVPSPSEGGK